MRVPVVIHERLGGRNWRRRRRETEWVPGFPIMSYGPRFFSESFLDGHLVLKNFALMEAWSPIFSSVASVLCLSTFFRYLSWPCVSFSFNSTWTHSNAATN